MRITIELEPGDINHFMQALARSRRTAQQADEADILDAAKQALDSAPLATAPTYVRKRIAGVQRLVAMIEDDAWALPAPARVDVLEALVYFSDPEDLIPDDIEVIGLLDDAIMLELMLRKLAPVLRAYADFCKFREELSAAPPATRQEYAASLARKREALRVRLGKARRIANSV
ncbi:MAG: YkvA family protein [Rudaea sp.]|uniref:YkvA family protein n=1 Tax=Rudaea sp. TaxID=2136325 RepID=UPI0039E4D78C